MSFLSSSHLLNYPDPNLYGTPHSECQLELTGELHANFQVQALSHKQSLPHLQILWYHESFTVQLLSSCKHDQRQHVIYFILFYFTLLSGCCHLFLFWLIVYCTLNIISHKTSQFGSTFSVWYMTHLSTFSHQCGILYDICYSAKLIVISHAARSSTNVLFSRFFLCLHILHFLNRQVLFS